MMQNTEYFGLYCNSNIPCDVTLTSRMKTGLFLTFLGTWPVVLELGILRSFAQNWEFLEKYSVEICV